MTKVETIAQWKIDWARLVEADRQAEENDEILGRMVLIKNAEGYVCVYVCIDQQEACEFCGEWKVRLAAQPVNDDIRIYPEWGMDVWLNKKVFKALLHHGKHLVQSPVA